MKTVHAIYENGVFRPKEAVELPPSCEVEFEPRIVGEEESRRAAMDQVRCILRKRHASGEHDVAERHNEHQP